MHRKFEVEYYSEEGKMRGEEYKGLAESLRTAKNQGIVYALLAVCEEIKELREVVAGAISLLVKEGEKCKGEIR